MTHWVRALGKLAERRLLREWGGLPTAHYLRWRDKRLDPTTKRRYHTFLRTQGLVMPTAEQEAANPALAEEQLRSATTWLRNNRRGEQFTLLHAENASYGFRRNLYGAKPIGVSVAVGVTVAILWGAVRAAFQLPAPGLAEIAAAIDAETLAKLLLSLVCLVAWIVVVTQDWVSGAAHLYAKALLETCDTTSG
jgi:hypothetical protein